MKIFQKAKILTTLKGNFYKLKDKIWQKMEEFKRIFCNLDNIRQYVRICQKTIVDNQY